MARKPKRPKDRIDGYEPRELSEVDPWAAPEVRKQLEARGGARQDGNDQIEAYDGFVNTLTGIGDWSRDKSKGGRQGGPDFQVDFLSGQECKNRWRGSDLGGRVVETIPDEMTREGWNVAVQPSDDDDEAPDEDKTDAFPPKPGAAPGGAPGALAGGEGGPKPGLPQELALHPLFAQQSPAAKVKPLEVDDESTEQNEAIEGKLEELGALDAFWEALCYERAYGGAAILIGAQDGMDNPSKPLDENRIEDVTHLTVLRGGWDGEAVAWSWYRDLMGKRYGQPEMYMIRNMGVPIAKIPAPGEKVSATEVLPPSVSGVGYGPLITWVHESRLLVFPGIAVDRYARTQMRGWGDSVFMRCNEVLSQFNQTWGGVANLMTDFSQGILSIKGLTAALMANNKTSNGTQLVMKKAQSLNISRSVARMMLIDAEEKFERSTVSLGGLPELLQQFALRLAAAADMPVALLMGQAPAGLNATGASDIRFFYDRVAARQKKRMLPQLRRLISILLKAKNGPTDGEVPSRWDAKMKPLYQLSSIEKSTIYAANTTADVANVTAGIATAEEVAATRYSGSEYNDGPIVLDLEGRKQMADQDEADKAARAKMLLEASKEAGDDKAKEKEAKAAQFERMKNGEPEPGAPPADGAGGGQPGTKPGDEGGGGGKIEIHVKAGKGDEYEPAHAPAGTPEGGQFVSGGGSAAADPKTRGGASAPAGKVIRAPLAKTPAEKRAVIAEYKKKGVNLTEYQAGGKQVTPKLHHEGSAELGKREAEAWGAEHYDKWKGELAPHEAAAVKAYAGTEFAEINKSLRRGTGANPRIKDIDTAIAKTPGTPEAVTVYRGASLPAGLVKPGGTFIDRGFMSTSLNKDSDFAGNTHFAIAVPKGAKGAFLGQGLTDRAEEREFLLPRGTSLRIDEVYSANGTRYVKASVVEGAKGDSWYLDGEGDALRVEKFVWEAEDLDFDERVDFDPDQPRDEKGRWGSGGASAAAGGKGAATVEAARNGSLGMLRSEMPQIRSHDVPDFVQHMKGKGIAVEKTTARVGDLKFTQGQLNEAKVQTLKGQVKPDEKPVIVASDNRILDGHHRIAGLQAEDPNQTVPVYKVHADIHTVLKEARDYPKSERQGVEHDGKLGQPLPQGPKDATGHAQMPTVDKWVDHFDHLPKETWQLTMTGNPDKDPSAKPQPWRKDFHDQVVKEAVGAAKPVGPGEQKVAIMTMGGPASGKTTLVKKMGVKNAVAVDPDGIKELMPEYRAATGMSHQPGDGPRQAARDAAFMAHEESSYIAKRVRDQAISEGKNLVIDGTGKNGDKFVKQMNSLKEQGYHVHVVYSDLTADAGIPRMLDRASKTGRVVPEDFAREAYDVIPKQFQKIAAAADSFDVYNASGSTTTRAWSKGADGKETVHDPKFVASFKERNFK